MKIDFEELYRRFFKDVYLLVLSMSRDPHTTEEITQETFFKALKDYHHFAGRSSLRSWLCEIAKNLYFTHCRKQKRRGNMPQEQESHEDLEKAICDRDDALRLHRALHGLPEPYREVFSLRVFSELPFSEIAALFQRTESWARVTYHRAKAKLIEKMKGE